jgi:hypothetical protein
MPIILPDGVFFNTLCAIDLRPERIRTAETIGIFRLLAELIAKRVDAAQKLTRTNAILLEAERSNEHCSRLPRLPPTI